MKEVVSVNPFRCRMWKYHDRLEQHIDAESCRAEIESFLKHGQLIPALGRRLHGVSEYDFELIYGARRRFVAMHLNKKLLVEIRDVTDVEGIIAMDMENRHRRDISPYERGMSFRNYLHSGIFKSQDEIARALNISSSQVSRLLVLAHLPSVIVSAFESPIDICERWSKDLASVLKEPRSRDATCARARAISGMNRRPPPRQILRELLNASARGRKVKVVPHDDVVSDRSGKPLFRVRYLVNNVAVLLPIQLLSENRLSRVRSAIIDALEDDKTQVSPHRFTGAHLGSGDLPAGSCD